MHDGSPYRLISHRPGALHLRLGLGPGMRPSNALHQLKALLDNHSFWAAGRSPEAIRLMLKRSAAAVSAWQGQHLVGFGRASSDDRFRAVLWDVVVCSEMQGQGLGRELVETLLGHPNLRDVERVYLMTSNCSGFYERLGFTKVSEQHLMLLSRPKSSG